MTIYQIGDIASFAKGASVPRDRMSTSGDYLYLHYGDLYKGHDLYIDVNCPQKELPLISSREKLRDSQFARNDDIIYILTSETIDDLGKALLLKCPSDRIIVAGTETTILRVERTDLILPAYLNYLAQTEYFKRILRQYITGMKVFRVHPRDIAQIRIDAPSLPKQKAIVALLDVFHKAINLNNRINDYLEELLDGQFKRALIGADDSWKRVSLLDIANYKNGLAMQKFRPEGNDKGLPVLKIRELGQGYCGADAERCRSDIDESVLIRDGDLVFSWSGTLLLDFWAAGDAGLNQHLFKVTSKDYPSWFYYMWTKHYLRRFIVIAKDRATTMGHIKRSALQESEVLIPPDDTLAELTAVMQPMIDELIGLRIEGRKLEMLRDALLPKLMSGEIDVSNIESLTQLNNHLYGC